MSEEFFDGCLGCGMEYVGGVVRPVVDGVTITDDGTAISAEGSIASIDIQPIGGVTGNPTFPPGCNGLKFDCESGSIWYDTPACHISVSNRTGFANFTEEVATSSASRTFFSQLADPIDLGDCYEGMTGVIIGYTEFSTTITASQVANAPEGGTDPIEYLNGYEVNYGFDLSSGGTTVFKENLKEGKHMPGYQLGRRCLTHTIPFTACYDPARGLGQEVTVNTLNAYRGNTGTALADFSTSFVTTSKAFVMKER